MTLPIIQLPHATHTFSDGQTMQIRGLSRAEAIQLRALQNDPAELEILCVKAATSTTEEEARAWLSATPQDEVEQLVNAIATLSGLNPDEGKDDAGDLPSAKLTELISSLQRISESLSPKSGD